MIVTVTVGLALTNPYSASADSPDSPDSPTGAGRALTYIGSFFTRYETRQHYDVLGVSRGRFVEGDATAYRMRVGAHLPLVSLSSDMTAEARIVGQASGFLGQTGTVTGDAPLGLYQGYAHVRGRRLSLDIGRFAMLYGDGMVIGHANWQQAGRSFAGLRAGLTGDTTPYRIDVFATQTDEGRPLVTSGAGDGYFYGVYAALGPLLSSTTSNLAVDVYTLGTTAFRAPEAALVSDASDLATDRSATTVTLGLRTRARLGSWDYRLEAGWQAGATTAAEGGHNSRVSAFHGDLELGYRSGRLRTAVELLYASGDDPDTADRHEGWNDLFANRHKWLGTTDVIGRRTNVYSAALRLQYALAPAAGTNSRTILKLDAHLFARPQPFRGATGYAGTEVDASVVKPLARGFNLSGTFGVFQPDSGMYGSSQRATYGEVQLRLDI